MPIGPLLFYGRQLFNSLPRTSPVGAFHGDKQEMYVWDLPDML